ncbi:hypothetical protein [Natrinema sp. H-ect4]|uniref:hypothetical protein n=1 Tax=Natrinema sp. H-ect4 TaxID=3242699 RepID=UPI0035A8369F
MGKLLNLALILAVLPGYVFVMTSAPQFGDSCNSQDSRNKVGDVEGVSESIEICTEVTSEVEKKFFDAVWLPVYKWGMNVAQLHYAFFFTWAAAVLYVFLR